MMRHFFIFILLISNISISFNTFLILSTPNQKTNEIYNLTEDLAQITKDFKKECSQYIKNNNDKMILNLIVRDAEGFRDYYKTQNSENQPQSLQSQINLNSTNENIIKLEDGDWHYMNFMSSYQLSLSWFANLEHCKPFYKMIQTSNKLHKHFTYVYNYEEGEEKSKITHTLSTHAIRDLSNIIKIVYKLTEEYSHILKTNCLLTAKKTKDEDCSKPNEKDKPLRDLESCIKINLVKKAFLFHKIFYEASLGKVNPFDAINSFKKDLGLSKSHLGNCFLTLDRENKKDQMKINELNKAKKLLDRIYKALEFELFVLRNY